MAPPRSTLAPEATASAAPEEEEIPVIPSEPASTPVAESPGDVADNASPRNVTDNVPSDPGVATGDESFHTAAGNQNPQPQYVTQETFARYQREEASRRATDKAEIHESIRELKEALTTSITVSITSLQDAIATSSFRQRSDIEAVVDDRLQEYARGSEVERLSTRVEALSEQVEELSGRPGRSTAYSRSTPRTPRRMDPHEDHSGSEEDYAVRDTAPSTTPHPRRQSSPTDSMATTSVPVFTANRWLGPPELGLTELTPADDRFTQAVSYRRYRLHNRDSRVSSNLTRNLGTWARRLRHTMDRNRFSGRRPVAILNFLSSYKKALDGEDIPEAGGLLLMSNWLEGEALTTFEAMINDAGVDSVGFAAWPHAVQFLLETYCTDLNIEKAVDELERIRLEPKETITQFKNKLTKAARELAGAYSQDALLTRFIRNLPTNIRDIVRLELPKYKRSADASYAPATLSRIAAFAEAHFSAHGTTTKMARFRNDPVSQVDGKDVIDDARSLPPIPRPPTFDTHPLVAAVHGSPPSDYASTLTGYTPSTEFSVREPDDGAPPDAYTGSSMIPSEHIPREDVYAVTQTRGSFPGRQHQQEARPGNRLTPMVCFTCYLQGHLSTNCRHRARVALDPDFQRWQLENFRKLKLWQQMWLAELNRLPPSIPSEQANRLRLGQTCTPCPATPTQPESTPTEPPRKVLTRPPGEPPLNFPSAVPPAPGK